MKYIGTDIHISTLDFKVVNSLEMEFKARVKPSIYPNKGLNGVKNYPRSRLCW